MRLLTREPQRAKAQDVENRGGGKDGTKAMPRMREEVSTFAKTCLSTKSACTGLLLSFVAVFFIWSVFTHDTNNNAAAPRSDAER
jgi:hypothetical protein